MVDITLWSYHNKLMTEVKIPKQKLLFEVWFFKYFWIEEHLLLPEWDLNLQPPEYCAGAL